MFIGLEIQGETRTIACVVDIHSEFVTLDIKRNTHHGERTAHRHQDIACHFGSVGGGSEGFRLGAVVVQREVLQTGVGIGWIGGVAR